MDKLGVPVVFSIMGNGFYALAFCFIGPAPFLNIKPYLSLIQVRSNTCPFHTCL